VGPAARPPDRYQEVRTDRPCGVGNPLFGNKFVFRVELWGRWSRKGCISFLPESENGKDISKLSDKFMHPPPWPGLCASISKSIDVIILICSNAHTRWRRFAWNTTMFTASENLRQVLVQLGEGLLIGYAYYWGNHIWRGWGSGGWALLHRNHFVSQITFRLVLL